MNMLKYKDFIEEGDLVIIYLDVRHMYPHTIKRDDVFQSKYGAMKHNDCIGKKFGSRISCTRGWVHVLFPTPELWTVTLPHRTQILYAADISLIVMQLDLKPGSVVCEAGTGSGSLTHALARAVSPNGMVHTFDFHEQRVEVARKEFEGHGLNSVVRVGHRDVCSVGFGIDQSADAVFLDVPNPWEAVAFAAKALKLVGGRICTFSPCIEQTQSTCSALQENGFRDICTVECLQRIYDVKNITQPTVSLKTPESESDMAVDDSQCEEAQPANCKSKHQRPPSDCGESASHWAAMPPLQAPGHTGYLTHASYVPLPATT